METELLDATNIVLARGKHDGSNEGMCAMEFASVLAGESFSDTPGCVAWIFRELFINFNDNIDDTTRQRLVPYIPKVLNTANDTEKSARRYELLLEWMLKVTTPTWLRAAGLEKEAAGLQWQVVRIDMLDVRDTLMLRFAEQVAATTTALWEKTRKETLASTALKDDELNLVHLMALDESNVRAVASGRVFILAGSNEREDLANTLYDIIEHCMWIVTCNGCQWVKTDTQNKFSDFNVEIGLGINVYQQAAVYFLRKNAGLIDQFFTMLDQLIAI